MRVYKLENDLTHNRLGTFIKDSCNDHRSYDYRIRIPNSEYLDHTSEKTLEDYDLAPNQILFIEVRLKSLNFCFYND